MEFEEIKDYEKEIEISEEIKDVPSLLKVVLDKEQEYRMKKLEFEQGFNHKMITLNWDNINKERKDKGLTKIGSKELREAYVHDLLKDDEMKYIQARIEYHQISRIYDMAYKYSFEVLK